MLYGKSNGKRVIPCPTNGYLKTGEYVFNLPLLISKNKEIREQEGYMEVVYGKPPVMRSMQRLLYAPPVIKDGKIYVEILVEDIPNQSNYR